MKFGINKATLSQENAVRDVLRSLNVLQRHAKHKMFVYRYFESVNSRRLPVSGFETRQLQSFHWTSMIN